MMNQARKERCWRGLVRTLMCATAVFSTVSCHVLQGQQPAQQPDYWPTDGWKPASAETAGFHSDRLADGLIAIREEGIPIHSLMVVSHGFVVLDADCKT